MDLVSIVIPCYNHEKYIAACLQSVVDQKYQNIELLVCDDNSSDESYIVLNKYEPALLKRFDRVIVCKNEENMGVCKTLNKLIQMSRGKYIITIASDDLLRENAIDDYVQFMLHNDCDIAFANSYIIDENAEYPIQNDEKLNTYYKHPPEITKNLTQQLCSKNFISGANRFFKRNTYIKYGLYDERFCFEDWEYVLRVSKSGHIRYMDKVTMYYRVMDSSLSHYGTNAKRIQMHRKYYHDKLSLLNEYKLYSNKKSQRDFFSQEMRDAIVLNDRELIKEICTELKKERIKINIGSEIRLLFYQIGLYSVMRNIKGFCKENICKLNR